MFSYVNMISEEYNEQGEKELQHLIKEA